MISESGHDEGLTGDGEEAELRDDSKDVPREVFVLALETLGFEKRQPGAYRSGDCVVLVPEVSAIRPALVSGESEIISRFGIAPSTTLAEVIADKMNLTVARRSSPSGRTRG